MSWFPAWRRTAHAFGLLLLGGLASAQSALVGDTPSYRFNAPVGNAPGVTSLADLQGKPLFIEYWGTR